MMSNQQPDQQIQAEPIAPLPRSEAGDPDPTDKVLRLYRTRLAGTFFGAFAGILLGALVIAIDYWLTDYGDYAWEGAIYGAGVGLVGGAVIGFLERTLRGDLARPDVATAIGFIFGLGLIPVALLGVNEGSALRLVGILCIGPMGGLLFGAMLDRAFEAILQWRWSTAIGFGGFALGLSIGIVLLISEYSDPDLDEVRRDTWKLISDHWSGDPNLKDAKIRKITLARPEHRVYLGLMEATIAGQVQRFDLQVHVRHNAIKAKWIPRD